MTPRGRWGPFWETLPEPEKSGIFLYLNTEKKSITLNLKTATGVKILKELVKATDVLIENFEPRVMPGLGLGYETWRISPRLVMTSISNFGQTGPYREYSATQSASHSDGDLPRPSTWVALTCPQKGYHPLS